MRPYEPPTRDRSRRIVEVTVLLLAIPTVSLGLLGLKRGLRFGFDAGNIFLMVMGVLVLMAATWALTKKRRRP